MCEIVKRYKEAKQRYSEVNKKIDAIEELIKQGDKTLSDIKTREATVQMHQSFGANVPEGDPYYHLKLKLNILTAKIYSELSVNSGFSMPIDTKPEYTGDVESMKKVYENSLNQVHNQPDTVESLKIGMDVIISHHAVLSLEPVTLSKVYKILDIDNDLILIKDLSTGVPEIINKKNKAFRLASPQFVKTMQKTFNHPNDAINTTMSLMERLTNKRVCYES